MENLNDGLPVLADLFGITPGTAGNTPGSDTPGGEETPSSGGGNGGAGGTNGNSNTEGNAGGSSPTNANSNTETLRPTNNVDLPGDGVVSEMTAEELNPNMVSLSLEPQTSTDQPVDATEASVSGATQAEAAAPEAAEAEVAPASTGSTPRGTLTELVAVDGLGDDAGKPSFGLDSNPLARFIVAALAFALLLIGALAENKAFSYQLTKKRPRGSMPAHNG